MNEQIVVDNERLQRRSAVRVAPDAQLKKAELSAITGADVLVLATAIGQTVVNALDMNDRRRMRRRLVMAACGIALLVGVARLAVQLLQS